MKYLIFLSGLVIGVILCWLLITQTAKTTEVSEPQKIVVDFYQSAYYQGWLDAVITYENKMGRKMDSDYEYSSYIFWSDKRVREYLGGQK